MYTRTNYRTKRALIADVKAGESVAVYQPGAFGFDVADGWVSLEGPHYPEPHKWYARARVVGGRVVEVR